ncbi:type I DNA topoisomerase [bacterium]|nr:type I DNA topoisomerase [bacterium]
MAKRKAAPKPAPGAGDDDGVVEPKVEAAQPEVPPDAPPKRPRARISRSAAPSAGVSGAGRKKKVPAEGRQGGLIIVESPAKAKTIERYTGGAYEVIATMGHVKDLPKDRFGIDIKLGFKPYWRVVPARAKLLKEIRDRAKQVADVLIATDPDREGEAIGYHVAEEIDSDNIRRVEFHEITASAVREALLRPRDINTDKVNSQFARRILDRIVGYRLSPLLWKTVRSGLSAGRVQSVAVRLVCEREDKIKSFVPEKYFRIVLTLSPAERPSELFDAEIFKIEGKRRKVKTREEADRILSQVQAGPLVVHDFVEAAREHRPAPPLVTSTFQQAAVNRFGMTARHAMVLAQQLYEGINLGKFGRRGLITYHRTDSVRLASTAVTAARTIIREKFGPAYIPTKPNFFKNKRAAQDAHEAIRPADVELDPERIAEFLTDEQRQLYRLIWDTFVASQMNPAVYDVRTVYLGVPGRSAEGSAAPAHDFQFVARGESLKFDGHLRLTGVPKKEGFVPALKVSERLSLHGHKIEEKETQPPARFTEASLVRELEHRGIGRPSTYASILSTVTDRGYVIKRGKELAPTELGDITSRLLISNFPDVMNIDFTAGMEEKLDQVEEGKVEWKEMLKEFYKVFSERLTAAQETLKDKKKELTKPPIEVACHSCGRPMVMRWSKYGKFLACSGYPECHSVRDIDETGGVFKVLQIDVSPTPCPVCGSEVHSRRGPFGRFWACMMFPKCKYTRPITLGIACPKGCGGEVVRRRTRRGRFFYGCSKYPDCNFTSWLEPVIQACPVCGHGYLVRSKAKGKNLVKCPVKECTHVVEAEPEQSAAPVEASNPPSAE